MKVLLISANKLQNPYPVYPLGLDYVAASICDKHEVRIVDMNDMPFFSSENETEDMEGIIRNFNPDVIGLSLRNMDNTDLTDPMGFIGTYRELMNRIRKTFQSSLSLEQNASKYPVIVLGGSGFTIFPHQTMAALDADYGIIGEGERFSMLLESIQNKKDPSKIPGVISRNQPAEIPPPWEGNFQRYFDAQSQHVSFYLKKGGMLNLQTKRGCIFKCVYCTYPHIEGRKMRLIEPEEIAATALMLQNAGAKYFFVTDSAFNAHQEHSIEVAQAFIRAKISIPWGAFIAPTKLPDYYFRILADAGMTHAELGSESLSDPVLKAYQKPFRVEDVMKAHESANQSGIHVCHYFLLGGPGESRETLNETLTRIDSLKKTVVFFFCGMRIYPFTLLYNLAIKEGQITENQSLIEPVFYRIKDISGEEIIRKVEGYAAKRANWIAGSGGNRTSAVLSRMYARGKTGPMWEYLIR